jgi:hypothetical protein
MYSRTDLHLHHLLLIKLIFVNRTRDRAALNELLVSPQQINLLEGKVLGCEGRRMSASNRYAVKVVQELTFDNVYPSQDRDDGPGDTEGDEDLCSDFGVRGALASKIDGHEDQEPKDGV